MKNDLTKGNIPKLLLNKTIPMFFGMMGMIMFNLVDTYFVGKLGKTQLAALSMTFPVVFFINSITQGIGVGVSSLVSRTFGSGNQEKLKKIISDSLSLGILVTFIIALIGYFTMTPLFKLLGATDAMLGMIKEYMSIWYITSVFVVIPMVGNNALRGLGDTKNPGIIMLVAVFINLIFDPLLIFGYGPFPALGIRGAAIATAASRALTLIYVLWLLAVKKGIIKFSGRKLSVIIENYKKLLYIGIPSGLTRVIMPVSIAILTRIVSAYGESAIAGYGVGTRVEGFAFIVVISLSTVMAPFMGQNFGARQYDRMREGMKSSIKFTLGWSIILYIALYFLSNNIAQIFNKDANVIIHAANFIRIVGFGFTMQGIYILITSVLNALNKPMHSTLLSVIELFVICVPLAIIGSKIWEVNGVYFGIMISYVLTGIMSLIVFYKYLPKIINQHEKHIESTKEEVAIQNG